MTEAMGNPHYQLDRKGHVMEDSPINIDFGHGEKDLRVPHEPIKLEDGRRIFIQEWIPSISVIRRDVTKITIHGILSQPAYDHGEGIPGPTPGPSHGILSQPAKDYGAEKTDERKK